MFACTLYRMVQNLDGGNIDEFDEFVAIHKILHSCLYVRLMQFVKILLVNFS